MMMMKPGISPLDIQVEDCLESNSSHKFERSMLIGGNPDPCFVLTKYSGTSTLGAIDLAAASATISAVFGQTVGAPGVPTAARATPMSQAHGKSGETITHVLDVPQSEYLLVMSGEHLRLYNKAACFKKVFDTESPDFERKEEFNAVGIRLLVANPSYIVGIGIKSLLYWKLPVAATALGTDFKVFSMTDYQDESGQIGSVSEFSSFIDTDKLIIINNNPSTCLFQVWNLLTERLEGWAKHPAKAEGTFTESFLTFKMSQENGVVAGTCRSSMYLWDTTQTPSPETHLLYNVPVSTTFDNVIITALHADSDFIIVGDNYGVLTLLSSKGKEIYRLNASESQAPKTININSLPFNQLSAVFKEKVNDILRVGRWVLASFASGRICLYDIFTPELPAPIDTLPVKPPLGAPAVTGFTFCIAGQKVYCLAHPPAKDPKSGYLRLSLEAWTPEVGYGSFTDYALRRSTWLKPPVPMLVALLEKFCKSHVLNDQEHAAILKETKAAEHFLREREKDIVRIAPFLLIRRVVGAYDAFESCASTLSAGPVKEKHKRAFYSAAAEFFRSVKTVKDVIEFYAPPPPGTPTSVSSLSTPVSVIRRKSLKVPVTSAPLQTPLSPSGLSSAPPSAQPQQDDGRDKDPDASSVVLSPPSSSSPAALSRDDRIGEMLVDLDTTLMGFHNRVDDAIESFDSACNAEPPVNDDAKTMVLMSMYTRLYQFEEDFKEAGKDVAMLRGATTNNTWHGQGGNYNIPIEIKSSK